MVKSGGPIKRQPTNLKIKFPHNKFFCVKWLKLWIDSIIYTQWIYLYKINKLIKSESKDGFSILVFSLSESRTKIYIKSKFNAVYFHLQKKSVYSDGYLSPGNNFKTSLLKYYLNDDYIGSRTRIPLHEEPLRQSSWIRFLNQEVHLINRQVPWAHANKSLSSSIRHQVLMFLK